MNQTHEQAVRAALERLEIPVGESNDDLKGRYLFGALGCVESIVIENSVVTVDISLGMKSHTLRPIIEMRACHLLEEHGFDGIQINIGERVLPSLALKRVGQLKNVGNILMVASGKGGVGKSTTAINLALALQAEGASVGILDADIYGPSMRTMLGVASNEKPELVDGTYARPIKKHGLKSMSIGYMSESKTPMIWRGPMAVRALQQLLESTVWGELDYLIIDMPPGTGDIHISLAQQVNVSAAVVVTTPQEMALADARKGLAMFEKVGMPVLGIVENMATHVCSSCGCEDHIFGEGGAKQLALEYQTEVLGSLPLHKHIREDVDGGQPTVVKSPSGLLARAYKQLANKVALELWINNRRAPPILRIEVVVA
jgi:ATP-binding protein involved in chromosome partitioning